MTMMVSQALAAAPTPSAAGCATLLVHVQPGDQARPRLDCAVALAGRLGAMLIGVGAEDVPPLGMSDPYGLMDAQWTVEMQRLVTSNLAEAEALFRNASAGLPAEWIRRQAPPASAVVEAAREADLIIAGGAPRTPVDSYRQCATAELVTRSGRPVLVAPPAGGELLGEAVLIAWKDTREARRALADALPFLKAAKTVALIEVCQAEDELEGAAARIASVQAGLRRHGVDAAGEATVAPAEQVCFELELAAAAINADLIVAGGYGHSRLGEWIFGGVTFDLLNRSSRFVLMSH